MSNTGSSNTSLFHVSKNGESLGPWTIEEIAERLSRSELAATDFLFDVAKNDWVTLLECEPLKDRIRQAKPKAPPPAAPSVVAQEYSADVSSEMSLAKKVEPVEPKTASVGASVVGAVGAEANDAVEWYVLKGEHRFGPFSYLNVVRALQEKSVYEFDFVWREGMEGWQRLAEHPEFNNEKIRSLQNISSSKDIFFERRMPRLPYDCEVIVHDDRSAWMGRSYEGSAGGSGLVIENATLVPGQIVRLHFAPIDGLPAFNAVGEIVSKRFTKEVRNKRTPVKYAVRYLAVDHSAVSKVTEYFQAPQAKEAKSAQ